jgi:hypothetical protein
MMGAVPPKTPPRPYWMNEAEYRKVLEAERRMLTAMEKSQTVKRFTCNWFRDVWRYL